MILRTLFMKKFSVIIILVFLLCSCSKSDSLNELPNDIVDQVSDKYISLDMSTTYQTIDGFGAGYAFDSPVGPIQLFTSYGTQSQAWQFYLYFGYWF